MIKTTLGQLERYAPLHPAFSRAFEALRQQASEPFEAGVTPVDGERIYINAFSYDTKPPSESQMEAHRKYVDVMYLYDGAEHIGCCSLDCLTEITAPYAADGDALLARLPQGYTVLDMRAGDVAVFFPEDAHCPGLTADTVQHVKKMVVKVLL